MNRPYGMKDLEELYGMLRETIPGASLRTTVMVGFPGEGKKRDEEIADLKRKLAKAEQERDFLKDAAVFFAKESK